MNSLQDHIETCQLTSCGCKMYLRSKAFWASKLTFPSGCSWLRCIAPLGAQLQWRCWLCEKCARPSSGILFTFGDLSRHAQTLGHRRSVAEVQGEPPIGPDKVTVPSLDLFESQLMRFQAGQGREATVELPQGLVGRHKMDELLWCLNEGFLQHQHDKIREAVVLNVSRDERHGRLHVRFRCCNDKFEFYSGTIGQSVDHTPDAIGLSHALQKIFQKSCTLRLAAPPSTSVPPEFQQGLYDHMVKITEAISVDSEANELTSARDMSNYCPDLRPKFLQHLKFTLRDAAHSARRILSRGFGADPVCCSVDTTATHYHQ